MKSKRKDIIKEFTSLVSAVWADNGYSMSKAQKKYDLWLKEHGYVK